MTQLQNSPLNTLKNLDPQNKIVEMIMKDDPCDYRAGDHHYNLVIQFEDLQQLRIYWTVRCHDDEAIKNHEQLKSQMRYILKNKDKYFVQKPKAV